MLRTLGSVLLIFVATSALLHAEDELLDPQAAFRFSAKLIAPDTLEVNYRIAEGYYMYRDRYRFSVQPDSIALAPVRYPAGEIHDDEFFGASEVYRNDVTIQIPIESGLQARQTIRLVAISQGCADVGVCYLPETQTADFMLLGLSGPSGNEQ